MNDLRDFAGYVNQKLFDDLETYSSHFLRRSVGAFSNFVKVVGGQTEGYSRQLEDLRESMQCQGAAQLSEMSTDLNMTSNSLQFLTN